MLWLRISVSTLLKKMLAKATAMFVSMAVPYMTVGSFPGACSSRRVGIGGPFK